MPTPPIKLFISYRSLDSAKVDTIAARLVSLKQDVKIASVYSVWQDKYGIPAGKDWWVAIVDAIIDCNIFLFFISEATLASDVCKAELYYAYQRNRPIIPIVLEGEFHYNTATGKNDVAYWDKIPSYLNESRVQFLFYEGASFFDKFQAATADIQADLSRWQDIDVPRPIDPRDGTDAYSNSIIIYAQACDHADRQDFVIADELFRKLMRSDPDFASTAREWLEILIQYGKLRDLDAHPATRFQLPAKWAEYIKLFPKTFIEGGGMFDPQNFGPRFEQKMPSAPTHHEEERHLGAITPLFNPTPPLPVQGITQPTLDTSPVQKPDMFNAVVAFLSDFFPDRPTRKNLILEAFYDDKIILDKIDYEGGSRSFTSHLVDMLRKHGESRSGTQALWHLLVTLKLQLGTNRHSEIDVFRAWANKALPE